MHPHALSGSVLNTPWVEKEDTKLEISLRKKILLKQVWEIGVYHWQLKSALEFSIPWLCHISGKKRMGMYLSQKFHFQWYGSLSGQYEKKILLKIIPID